MNANELLLIVHPGSRIHIREKPPIDYGDYKFYLSRLAAAVQKHDSVILRDKKYGPPFELHNNTKVIPDTDNQCDLKDMIPLLRNGNYERIHVCGEFLWAYTLDMGKNMVEYAGKPPRKKQGLFDHMMDTSRKLSRKKFENIGLDYDEFVRATDKFTVVADCCVKHVYSALAADFPVAIKRELCYPETGPPKNTRY